MDSEISLPVFGNISNIVLFLTAMELCSRRLAYIECPSVFQPRPNHDEEKRIVIFLAGGISNAVALFDKSEIADKIALLNPRRSQFDVTDTSLTEVQIKWEADHLRKADLILFWFPSETLCPITLYELGAWSYHRDPQTNQPKPIFVGTHPKYARLLDVQFQTSLVRPEVAVVHSVEDLVQQVVTYVSSMTRPKQ
eukprot:GEZU01014589.1.p1 GENE.GEZU01014589.1~~GEZU01014589.1.p1  ORF type:complete len:195 (+),score=24.63 GEZU01014589.1:29-613(+)